MNWLIGILGGVAILSNSLMDEIRFRWSRCFGQFIKPDSKAEKWFNPAIGWKNKHRFKSKFLKVLFSTALVWTTDFWHFLKAIFLNSLFAAGVLLENSNVKIGEMLLILLGLNIIWGILFESFTGVYGAIGDKKRLN